MPFCCVVGGCGNSSHGTHGFTIYNATRVDPAVRKSWILFVKNTRKDYKISKRNLLICDGHFRADAFEPSQLSQYNLGFRDRAPTLLRYAVPSRRTTPKFSQFSRHQPDHGPKNSSPCRGVYSCEIEYVHK